MSFYSNLPSVHTDHNAVDVYPTIFEIISSQEIDDLLPASVRYILTKYWVSQSPTRFSISVNNYFDEWFNLGLRGLVEWYHLKHYNSTFVDKFYGLQRFDNSKKDQANTYFKLINEDKLRVWPEDLRLKNKQRLVVWLQKILLPWVTVKLDDLFKTFTAQLQFMNGSNDDEHNKRTTFNERIKQIFIKCYPSFKKLSFVLDLIVKLFFLKGTTGSISFLDYLFKIEYSRSMLPMHSDDNTPLQNAVLNRRKHFNKFTILNQASTASNKIIQILSFMGSQLFPTFMFVLKVYQWWMSQDLTAKLQKKLNNIDEDIPRPPLQKDTKVSTDICVICHNKIQNPAVIETGYVTCYPCAITYLKEHEGTCPVTKQKLLGCKYDPVNNEWDVLNSVRKLLI